MNHRTATSPTSRPRGRTHRNRAGIVAALTAALPLALGLLAPAPAQAFTATSPTGIDVSKWQRPGGVQLDWGKVAASGEQFAFIKATDGIEGLSPYFAEDSKAAADAGLIIGSYHKAHPDRDAIVQADAYAAALALRPSDARTLPPVLDIELDAGMTPAQLEKWSATFLERVELKTGDKPMVYTYRWFWTVKMANTTSLSTYPLWLAAYQDQPPTDIPGGWKAPLFWQRSSTGKVPGINTPVDLNTFNGSKAELDALVKGGAGGGTAPGVTGNGAGAATAAPENRGTPKSPEVAEGKESARKSDDTGVGPDAVSPPTGRAADVIGSSELPPAGAGRDGDAVIDGGAGNGGDGPVNPVASSELVESIIDVVRAGSSEADLKAAIETVREAAQESGLEESQIDTLIAFLEQAVKSGKVPEGQLEEIGAAAPAAVPAADANAAAGKTNAGTANAGETAVKPLANTPGLATYSDVVALLAGALR